MKSSSLKKKYKDCIISLLNEEFMTLRRYGWSLEKRDWNDIPFEIINGNWEYISYHEMNKQLVPQCSGLYILEGITKKNFPIKFCTPLYIGHTLSLRRRYGEHLATKGKKILELNLNCTFHYIKLESYLEDELKLLETKLIQVFGPVINDIMPISTGVRIIQKLSNSNN